MTQELSQTKKLLKQAYLKHGIFRAIVEEMETLVTPLEAPPIKRYKSGGSVKEHLVMHVSDAHADSVVDPEKVGGIEKYDFKVALCRAERYVDKVIEWSQKTLANHQFDTLWFLSYGDMTNGEIHGALARSEYQNSFKSSLAIGQMQALMIRDLAPYFRQINMIGLSGNHGRRSVKKDYHGSQDNWDYLINEVTRLHCRELTNVNFMIPNAWSVNVEINGHGFNIFHGDDIPSSFSIPWYGLERKTRRLVALNHSLGKQAKYFVCGHFHSQSTIADLKGETLINGAWLGTDPYSYEAFSGYREPTQLIHGVHEKYGVSWRMPVKLRDDEAEKRGPERYACCIRED